MLHETLPSSQKREVEGSENFFHLPGAAALTNLRRTRASIANTGVLDAKTQTHKDGAGGWGKEKRYP